jgi:hypothetical protein
VNDRAAQKQSNKDKNMHEVIKQAKALKKDISFKFEGQTYQIPYVIQDRFIVNSQLCAGGFGCIF